MSRARRIRIVAAVVAIAAAAGAGLWASSRLGPERLEREILRALERATKGPVEVADLRLAVGFPVEVEGRSLRLYEGGLTADHASARIDVVSLLIGRPRLTRLRLSGAHLQLERLPGGKWEPPLFERREPPEGEPALAPLRVIESGLRLLLARRFLADTLVVRHSTVTLRHPALDGSGETIRLDFEGVSGRLMHSRLFGDAKLFLGARVVSGGQDAARLELQGTRGADAAIDAEMLVRDVRLEGFEPYLKGLQPGARLVGTLDGRIDVGTRQRGRVELQLDLSARGFSAGEAGAPPLESEALALRGRIAVDADRVGVDQARLSADGLEIGIDASLARPLGAGSAATLALSLGELPLGPDAARSLAAWLPRSGRERFLSVAERVRSGRLVRGALRGRTTISRWGETLAGGLERLPEGLELSLEVEALAIEVDEANRLESLRGRLHYADDTLEVAEATAVLNGGPLPELRLSLGGLSRLLAAPVDRRQMAPGTRALVGVTPLWEVLRPQGEDSGKAPPRIELYLEELEHPALLWPLRDVAVELRLESGAEGVHMDVRECRWAGVRVDGEVDWTVAPDRRIDIRLVTSDAPADLPPDAQVAARVPDVEAPEPGTGPRAWATGRLEVGAVEGDRWSHRALGTRFAFVGGELRLAALSVELESGGRLVGGVELDLAHADRVPYRAQLALLEGDASSLVGFLGGDPGGMAGPVELGAALAGHLVPGRPLLHDTDGRITFEARDGSFRREVPAFVALALASGSFNPFASLERVRFDRVDGVLTLERGRLSTRDLEIDGPDLHLFASGSLDMRERPHALDMEVVLFLFRQLDRAIEYIPLVNVLLLGENNNLLAAYFQLVGTWDDPVAKPKPLRTIEEGPTEVLTRRIPRIVTRGMRALGGLFRRSPPEGEAGEKGEPPAGRPRS